MLLLLIGGYSLLLTAMLLHTTSWLLRQIRLHMQEEYSNSEDFPVRFAGFVVFMPVLYLGAAWWLFFTGDHNYNMWFHGRTHSGKNRNGTVRPGKRQQPAVC